jgi:outer membrane receptor for ferrienterochelin and colicins
VLIALSGVSGVSFAQQTTESRTFESTTVDWCPEHRVPESECTICHPELAAKFKEKGDWCGEHGLPESHCYLCNPGIKFAQETQYLQEQEKANGISSGNKSSQSEGGSQITSTATEGTSRISGIIKNPDGQPLGFANVQVEKLNAGVTADQNGYFALTNLPAGNYDVRVSLLGYQSYTITVELIEGQAVEYAVTLAPDVLEGREVNVETDKIESGIGGNEPVRKEVVSGDDLRAHSLTGSIVSGLEGGTGLKTRPCSLCGACGVGMQGLDPSYTEINVDGMPVISGVGSLYGVESLTAADVSSVELVKGASSAEYGSGAIGGAVNLVTERASTKTVFRVAGSANNNGQNTQTITASGLALKVPMRLSIMHSGEPQKLDQDDDNLTDTPQYERLNLTYSMSSVETAKNSWNIGGRIYTDDRFAGELNWTKDDRGSTEIYGRDILTNRREVSGRYGIRSGSWNLSAQSALVWHDQKSWYGATEFNPSQRLILTELSATNRWSQKHETLFQLVHNYQDYEDNLELAMPTDLKLSIPGVVAMHTWSLSEKFTAQAGSRAEYYEEDGVVFVPRASLRWKPVASTAFRVTGGLGYRPVTLYSIDGAVEAGFENVNLSLDLPAERTQSVSTGLNKQWVTASTALTFDLNLYLTHFDNKVIVALTDVPGEVEYRLSDDGYTRGAEAQMNWVHTNGLRVKAGAIRSQSRYLVGNDWMNAHLQYTYTADGLIGKTWKKVGLTAELSADLYGPQHLPEGHGREMSPEYVLWDTEVRKTWKHITASLGMRNIFDWTQSESPYRRDPQGRLLPDSALMYGTLLGRTIYAGLAYSM